MKRVAIAIVLVLAILFVVAFAVYGALSAVAGLKTPEGASPLVFLTSVLVIKTGHAIAFVLIFYLGRSTLGPRWLTYAFLWWLMFAIGEVGQAIGPGYSWMEAIAGLVAEAIYFPAAAYVTNRAVGRPFSSRTITPSRDGA